MSLKVIIPFRSAFAWACLLAGLATPTSHGQPESAGATSPPDPEVSSWWSFDEDMEGFVHDAAGKVKDPVFGNTSHVPGVRGKALKLDGFRTHAKRENFGAGVPAGAFTVESWIAPASYPWSWAPVLDCSYPRIKGFFFGIDREGRVGFKVAAGGSWYEATSQEKIPLGSWTHVAAVFEPDERISVFIDGKQAASLPIEGQFVPARRGSLTIGRNNRPQTWNEFQLSTKDAHFHLDGLLDEIRITSGARTEDELGAARAAVTPPAPALSKRDRLPTGPVGSGSFGAFHTRLDYYEEWDDLWRVSEVPDVFVRFDQSPVQLVFWRGTSFVPCWVTENGVWYTNEWLETWGRDVASCAEPIMDRQCRYSHVRIIENTDARVVVHWRYALSDAFYDFAAVSDDGRGEWCDEFHTIYPDQVGVRKMQLHYSRPERKHDWVEQIVVLPPGKTPDDVMERDGVSLVNMAGEVQKYSWHDEDLQVEMPEPAGANMSVVHLKSAYRPFIIVSPDPVETVEGTWDSPFFRTYASKMAKGYRPDPAPSVYGWWDHWPVAQVPGDGRWVVTPDRPSHFNLTTFVQWKDHEKTRSTRTRIMLQGMTDQAAGELVPLARSWLQAPQMRLRSETCRGGRYDQAERAYVLESSDPDHAAPCAFGLEASEDSPLLNPAFIIRNWGTRTATLSVDGRDWKRGKDFRQGIRRGVDGEDLIVWLRLDARKPVEIVLKRESH